MKAPTHVARSAEQQGLFVAIRDLIQQARQEDVLPKLTAIAQEASEDDRRAVGVGVLHAAVNGGQWSLLKPLHDIGFQVDAARAGTKAVESLYDSLASLVARGDWPEIELIAPDLLLQDSARKRVVEAIGLYLVIENIRHYSDHWLMHLDRLQALPGSELLEQGGMNETGVRMCLLQRPSAEVQSVFEPAIHRLVQWGWIQPADILAKLQQRSGIVNTDPAWLSWWSDQADAWLEAHTALSGTEAGRRAPRL